MGFIDTLRAEGHAVESVCRVLREQGCQVGAKGEAWVARILQGWGRILGRQGKYVVNGRTRIYDFLTSTRLVEVKNVKVQRWSQQIEDGIAAAKDLGVRYTLVVRRTTRVSPRILSDSRSDVMEMMPW